MSWSLEEAIAYYRTQGAPGDQSTLTGFLREVQRENGGGIPLHTLTAIVGAYAVKESFLLAVIKRIPSLHLADTNCLELCAGPNCSKRGRLAAFVEKTYGESPKTVTLKYVPCMRMCGKGPNIRWNGKLYHQADEQLLRRLIEGK